MTTVEGPLELYYCWLKGHKFFSCSYWVPNGKTHGLGYLRQFIYMYIKMCSSLLVKIDEWRTQGMWNGLLYKHALMGGEIKLLLSNVFQSLPFTIEPLFSFLPPSVHDCITHISLVTVSVWHLNRYNWYYTLGWVLMHHRFALRFNRSLFPRWSWENTFRKLAGNVSVLLQERTCPKEKIAKVLSNSKPPCKENQLNKLITNLDIWKVWKNMCSGKREH